MSTEVSAGGIIVYKGRSGWRVLLMKDLGGNWTFPKGKVEKGEGLQHTARREIEEEVGLTDLMYVSKLKPAGYWYHRGKSIQKTVHYFLFRSKTRQKTTVQMEEGISAARWVHWEKAHSMIGYPKTNLPLLTEAKKKCAVSLCA